MTSIVVIEDNHQNARLAEKLLKRAEYTVLLAEDGETGLTTVFENHPDIILIDLGLPDIDGQTVIGLIRQHEELKAVPIIAFTAWPEEEAHDMATRYGCDGIITKPINTRTFADDIGKFLIPSKTPSEEANTDTTDKPSAENKVAIDDEQKRDDEQDNIGQSLTESKTPSEEANTDTTDKPSAENKVAVDDEQKQGDEQ